MTAADPIPLSPLRALAERWATAKPAERANAQLYLAELAHALDVEPPRPAGTGYEFEFPVRIVARDGTETSGRIDLYKEGHFALEAKHDEAGRSGDLLLRKAFGQLRGYIGHLPHERPPYLLVLDVGRTLLVWDRWSGDYGGYSAGRRIDLARLDQDPEAVALLRDVFTNPAARDPRGRAAAVTREIAGRLAELAAALEGRGHDQEVVARFLMRVVFTMFAEDVDLLPRQTFRHLVEEVALANPAEFVEAAEDLWRAMDSGARFGGRRLLRFNGHFFRDARALPLERADIALLLEACRADWQHVDPSIFGTLLVRALDPVERHRLGAEYTPREFVDRLVRPTVEEPIRERWTAVQAEVLQLRETGKDKDRKAARERLEEFQRWLRGLRFLDPACGSGNFLVGTLHAVKRIELEVIRALEEVTGQHDLRLDEVKPWAREIAELTLWIGYHQFWKAHHHVQPEEPILTDTGTLECRDAVLTWREVRHDPERDRPDPTPRIPHPVTGELVPDPAARLPYMEYVGAEPAPWPQADFIIGNPPYLGKVRQREALGDGYVDVLRSVYTEVPDSADLVLYWWYRAAREVSEGRTTRAGLITTKSITQAFHRPLVTNAERDGASIVWAIADHPWVDDADGADVRIAMTVISRPSGRATLVRVDEQGSPVSEIRTAKLNPDLTAHADLTKARELPVLSNRGLAAFGFMLAGEGFLLEPDEATQLRANVQSAADVVRPYVNGRDLAARARGLWVIDFALRSEDEARAYSILYDLVRDRVKPQRDTNNDRGRRTYWWRFGRTNEQLRDALSGLHRYIATVETSKHRFFTFLDSTVAADHKVTCVASDDAFTLGVLSSSAHVIWATAAGSRHGVGNDPVYNKTSCFDPFPFPDPTPDLRAEIAAKAEALDAHRKAALARDERVTMTGMYNVVEKLRAGAPLTAKEQAVHTLAACGVLRDLHDELDALVARAYGWSWPEPPAIVLERLVALHDERVREEAAGRVRWLRPDYQIPRFGRGAEQTAMAVAEADTAAPTAAAPAAPVPWPRTALEQIALLKTTLGQDALSAEDLAARFVGARRDLVERHLETLAIMGELVREPDGRFHAPAAVAYT